MPSQFSTLGFDVRSGDDLAALASRVADRSSTMDVEAGHLPTLISSQRQRGLNSG
jgi:hypothetical protein